MRKAAQTQNGTTTPVDSHKIPGSLTKFCSLSLQRAASRDQCVQKHIANIQDLDGYQHFLAWDRTWCLHTPLAFFASLTSSTPCKQKASYFQT